MHICVHILQYNQTQIYTHYLLHVQFMLMFTFVFFVESPREREREREREGGDGKRDGPRSSARPRMFSVL